MLPDPQQISKYALHAKSDVDWAANQTERVPRHLGPAELEEIAEDARATWRNLLQRREALEGEMKDVAERMAQLEPVLMVLEQQTTRQAVAPPRLR